MAPTLLFPMWFAAFLSRHSLRLDLILAVFQSAQEKAPYQAKVEKRKVEYNKSMNCYNKKQTELNGSLRDYVGRETTLYFAERLIEHYKRADGEGPHIYLKREDLNHTGAHGLKSSVNNFAAPVEEWTVNGTALTMRNKTRC